MEHENYASKGVAGTGLGLSIGALSLAALSGGLGNLGGVFGTVGDKGSDDFCIKQLLANKLKDQYCFKTEDALKCLKFVEGERIWLK